MFDQLEVRYVDAGDSGVGGLLRSLSVLVPAASARFIPELNEYVDLVRIVGPLKKLATLTTMLRTVSVIALEV